MVRALWVMEDKGASCSGCLGGRDRRHQQVPVLPGTRLSRFLVSLRINSPRGTSYFSRLDAGGQTPENVPAGVYVLETLRPLASGGGQGEEEGEPREPPAAR